MFFATWAISVVLAGVALSLYEKNKTKWHMRLVWLSLMNAVGVARVNLMYFMETRLQ